MRRPGRPGLGVFVIGFGYPVVPEGEARTKAEAIAHDLTRFPRPTMLADRASMRAQAGLPEAEALRQEWAISRDMVAAAGQAGAARFAGGKGRHGDFEDL